MKRIYSLAASAALLAFTLPLGHAAPRTSGNSPALQAQATLEEVESLSASVADVADRVGWSMLEADPQLHMQAMRQLRDDINSIGRDVRSLAAERNSLTEWEAKVLDEITPTLQTMAGKVQKSIEIFNTERNHLWATPYREEIAAVYKEAANVKDLLDGYLKLASIHQRESRLESKIEDMPSTR